MYPNAMDLTAPDIRTHSERSVARHSEAAAVPARVKVLNPLTSTGPSMHGELLNSSVDDLQVRVPKCVLVGSTVQVRTTAGIAFGEVRSSVASGAEFEIGVAVQRSS